MHEWSIGHTFYSREEIGIVYDKPKIYVEENLLETTILIIDGFKNRILELYTHEKHEMLLPFTYYYNQENFPHKLFYSINI